MGKHLLHAATRPDVTAERFGQVPAWPGSVDGFEDLAASLGLHGSTPAELLESFDPARLPREPWTFAE